MAAVVSSGGSGAGGFGKNFNFQCFPVSEQQGEWRGSFDGSKHVPIAHFKKCLPADCFVYPDGKLFYKSQKVRVDCALGHVLRKQVPAGPDGVDIAVSRTGTAVELVCRKHIANKPADWAQTGLSQDRYCEPVQCPAGAIAQGRMAQASVYQQRQQPVCDPGYASGGCYCGSSGAWEEGLNRHSAEKVSKTTGGIRPCVCDRIPDFCGLASFSMPAQTAAQFSRLFRPSVDAALHERRYYHCPENMVFRNYPSSRFVELVCSSAAQQQAGAPPPPGSSPGQYVLAENPSVLFRPENYECIPQQCPETLESLERAGYEIHRGDAPMCNDQLGGTCRLRCTGTNEAFETYTCQLGSRGGSSHMGWAAKPSEVSIDMNRCQRTITLQLKDGMTKDLVGTGASFLDGEARGRRLSCSTTSSSTQPYTFRIVHHNW